MNKEWWKLNDEGWWFWAIEGFWWRIGRQTNKQKFVTVELLLRLKNFPLALTWQWLAGTAWIQSKIYVANNSYYYETVATGISGNVYDYVLIIGMIHNH